MKLAHKIKEYLSISRFKIKKNQWKNVCETKKRTNIILSAVKNIKHII